MKKDKYKKNVKSLLTEFADVKLSQEEKDLMKLMLSETNCDLKTISDFFKVVKKE